MTAKILSRPIAGWFSAIILPRSRGRGRWSARCSRRSSDFCPGTLWILIGATLGGGVHDMIVLFARSGVGGKTLGQMVKEEIGRGVGALALISVLAIMIIIMAVLALVVVQALAKSPWGVFTIAMTIPVAMIMGIGLRTGKVSVSGGHGFRLGRPGLRRLGRTIPFAFSRDRSVVSARRKMAGLGDHGLRTGGVDPAGLDAAHAARLSQHFSEAWDGRGAGARGHADSARRC